MKLEMYGEITSKHTQCTKPIEYFYVLSIK